MATVLITGANRGIGLALVRAYLKRGDDVVAVCRRTSPELETTDARIEAPIDVRRPGDVEKLAKRLEGTTVDVAILNAGVMGAQRFGEIDVAAIESMRLQFDTNAIGPLLVAQALVDQMSHGSKLALITSRMGSIADNTSGNSYGYRMSKAALNIAGVSLAHDLKPDGIAVAILHPGYVRTDMTEGRGFVDPEEAAANLVTRIDELTLETTGRFLHANGEALPW